MLVEFVLTTYVNYWSYVCNFCYELRFTFLLFNNLSYLLNKQLKFQQYLFSNNLHLVFTNSSYISNWFQQSAIIIQQCNKRLENLRFIFNNLQNLFSSLKNNLTSYFGRNKTNGERHEVLPLHSESVQKNILSMKMRNVMKRMQKKSDVFFSLVVQAAAKLLVLLIFSGTPILPHASWLSFFEHHLRDFSRGSW